MVNYYYLCSRYYGLVAYSNHLLNKEKTKFNGN